MAGSREKHRRTSSRLDRSTRSRTSESRPFTKRRDARDSSRHDYGRSNRPVRVAGNALTCEVAPGPTNWSIHVAVEMAQPGDLLVVTPTSPCDDGYFGELLATSLVATACVAVIIDAGEWPRRSREMTSMGFRSGRRRFARRGTVKRAPGNVQTPSCARELACARRP